MPEFDLILCASNLKTSVNPVSDVTGAAYEFFEIIAKFSCPVVA